MTKNIFYFLVSFFILSCSAKKKYESNRVLSRQLYEEGQHILSERIKVQASDLKKAMELNKKVLEKFQAAFNADTTNLDVLLFSSECTMFERDYEKCLYWTLKFIQQDTTNFDRAGFYERIGECYTQLGEVEKSKSYYEKASAIRNKSNVTQ